MDLFCDTSYKFSRNEYEKQQHMKSVSHTKNASKYCSKSREVFVTGFLPSVRNEDLSNYFSNFGEVKKVYIDKRRNAFAFVEFVVENDATKALNYPHNFGGIPLTVQKPLQRSFKIKSESSCALMELIPYLLHCSTVEEQIHTFCQKVSLTKTNIDDRYQACADLEKILKKYYPNCSVHVFGSTTSGFGLRGCDIDLLFEPHPNYWYQSVKNDQKINVKSLSVQEVEQGAVSAGQLADLPSFQQVQFLSKVLRKHSYLFFNPLFIPARVPIVKFLFKKLRLQCDLSCSNRLVLCNSQLLLLFGQLDERVTPLMMLLRYWGKLHDLIRVGALSSYAFSMLILFFLQQRSPPVIPSVMDLKSLATPGEERIEAGFDCSFCMDPNRVPKSKNNESIGQLLLGFFQFYAGYDFAFVVSPLMGEKMNREMFNGTDDNEEHCFKSSPICIQDPLETNRNITAFLKIKVLLLLKDLMKIASKSLASKMLTSNKDPAFGIVSILKNQDAVDPPLCILPNEDVLRCPTNGLMFTLAFRNDLKDCMSDAENNKGFWISRVSSTLFEIFEHGLCFEAEVVDKFDQFPLNRPQRKRPADDEEDDAPAMKKIRLEEGVSCPSSTNAESDLKEPPPTVPTGSLPENLPPQLLVSVQNIATHRVWSDRRRQKDTNADLQHLNTQGKYLELEHAVTTLIREGEHAKLPDKVYFICDCHMYRKEGMDRLVFTITPIEFTPDFKALTFFLKGFITYLLNDALQ